ncbi:hypothetical protein [Paenibacillus hexagrammi]|uniref:Uncharacterized protein n=1 Tax=Paenibacillus hexagrammi TaxID=2908839 RepID=A0ABY3SF12_9BACL|nr:hypothetical protein [Paenibacillus sp. YPD9-1]UJF32588.1 hypothetical protein L0M14_23540 [Paenibacillus sp. YPD9-1]
MQIRYLLVLGMGLSLTLSGCDLTESTAEAPVELSTVSPAAQTASVKEGVLHIEPSELFAGDAAKFKPFMDTAGSVKLQYTGNKKSIQTYAEIWENGSKTQTLGPFSSSLMNEKSTPVSAEWIISMKEVKKDGEQTQGTHYAATVALVHSNGSSSMEVDVDSSIHHKISAMIPSPPELDIPDDEDAPIWGFQATDESFMKNVDFTPESLKNAKWAVVFKVGMID